MARRSERVGLGGTAVLVALLVSVLFLLQVSCPPGLPATACHEDSDCPECSRCDVEGGFCYAAETCPGGRCKHDRCCTGCWSGDTCEAGDSESVCGAGGVECAACDTLSSCRQGRCQPPCISQVTLLDDATCALRSDTTVWCFGSAFIGRLGSGASNGAAALPQQVLRADDNEPLRDVTALSGQHETVCALDAAGGVWGWGSGDSGELGQGNTANRSRAVAVVNAEDDVIQGFVQVSVGGDSVCALRQDTSVMC